MLTTKNFENKVILEYYRDSKGNPQGVVVAIGPGILGWSLCSKFDTFTKEQGKNIALHRAVKARNLSDLKKIYETTDEDGDILEYSSSEREEFYVTVPDSLVATWNKIMQRSYIYYKHRE